MAIHGHCMCGAVNVTIKNPPSDVVYCHCDNCKRQSGASGTYVTIVSTDEFKVEGPVQKYLDLKTTSGTGLDRNFCGKCGSPVYSTTPLMPDKVAVKMGLFDQIPKASAEWFCKHKQEWEPEIEGAAQVQETPE